MGNVLLFQLDGKIPNLALTRLAAHHKGLGDDVELRVTGYPKRTLYDQPDMVYGSAIFTKSAEAVQRLKDTYPDAIVGGTGVNLTTTLEQYGIGEGYDYSLWPSFTSSIGFTQRGCRLTCKFCVVPQKEGKIKQGNTIAEIWRGGEYPKHIILLDNDFFGQPMWQDRVDEILAGQYKVCLMQGINIRFITDETAKALASMPCYDDQFKRKRIYTAWDNLGDEERVLTGLRKLIDCGVAPYKLMVYMLIGYWPGETEESWVYREKRIRELGAMAYPMPYVRNKETVGFQRWVVTHYSKHCSWEAFKSAGYRSPF